METNISTKACIPPGMWMTKLDLSDAYLHIPISRACSKYLRFVWNDNIYQLLALLFGLAVAPQVLAEFSDSSNSRAYPVCSGPLLFGRLTLGTNFSRLGSLSSYFSAFRLPCTRSFSSRVGKGNPRRVWSLAEQQEHINILEMRIALLALQALGTPQLSKASMLATHNATVVTYLKN